MSERPQDLVAAGYDAMVARYAEWAAQVVGDPRERYVRELLSRIPSSPDVLEIGCGAGVEPTPTLAAGGRLVGLSILESRPEPMEEPESEPGRGPETASFHWILAQKG